MFIVRYIFVSNSGVSPSYIYYTPSHVSLLLYRAFIHEAMRKISMSWNVQGRSLDRYSSLADSSDSFLHERRMCSLENYRKICQ
jgi:hypothetical protein